MIAETRVASEERYDKKDKEYEAGDMREFHLCGKLLRNKMIIGQGQNNMVYGQFEESEYRLL